jgi:ribA/ribD-fused uncharacterized protein
MRIHDKFVFFYGGPLSQWYPSKFTIDGVNYNTAEQFMMAKKAEYFDDQDALSKILKTNDPAEQKAIGRTVKNFDKEAWDAVSRGYVYQGNIAKFKQNEDLKKYLLSTEDKELVEASPYDKIWGIGLSTSNPDRFDKSKWKGTNWLGETLMKVRSDLK